MVVRDWPIDAQPEERLLTCGESRLTETELLALVVGNGRRDNALELARRLLVQAGGLHCLVCAIPTQGLTQEKAARLRAAFELGRRIHGLPVYAVDFTSSAEVAAYYIPRLCDLTVERFLVVLLNARNRLLRNIVVSEGSLTATIVHPREVFVPAITYHASSVILVHNHPSGDPTPSQDDLKITTQLVEAGRIIDIRVLDHIIVGRDGFTSLASKGLV